MGKTYRNRINKHEEVECGENCKFFRDGFCTVRAIRLYSRPIINCSYYSYKKKDIRK